MKLSSRLLPTVAFSLRRCVPLLAAACVQVSAAELPTYRVDVLGPDLQGFGMNEHGDATGRALLSGGIGKAFVVRADDGIVEILPVPGEWTSSDGYAISNEGVIVGAVSDISIASIGSRAAAWFPTPGGYEFALLGALPGHTYSTATGVNDLGDIVGGSGGIGLGLYSNSVLFSDGGPIDLPDLGLAADVNNNRVVLAGNRLLDLDTMELTIVPLPPGNWQGVVSADLNQNDGFCGYILGFSGCSTFPIRYRQGIGWEFIGGCATTTSAVSMNDAGDALTYVYQGGLGAVFVDEGYVNLTTLIDPAEGPWLVTGVSTINNARQVLASGKLLPSSTTTLIRLTPIVAGDLDGDGRVDGTDLGLLLVDWGSPLSDADLNGDGVVDGADLGILIGAWTG